MSGSVGTLGKYQIIREIARSNDIVYEAYDPIMNRRVALKELALPSGSTDQQREDRRNRFLREARAAGTLTHPNIVTVYEYGEDAGRHFIAMEFLEGHTLRNEIDTKGLLAPDKAIEIAEAVLRALEYAHDHGVIHRDIKPDNIQLLPDGRVKLTDFGIARLTFEPNLTMDGQVFGTPSYMSPEQVVGKDIDARSDLFSVGVVLYEMLAGKKPFAGDSVVSITYAIMNHTPSQPTQANWSVWQVLEQSLEKSPQLRPPSAKDMIAQLASAKKASSGVVIDPVQPMSQSQTMAPMAPPVQNPYAAPGPQPYNPYAPPVLGGPPATYTYNPYGQTGGANAGPPPVMGPGQGQYGFSPPPVYYPPAPRAPLVKPETKQFLGKLTLAFVVLGTVFGLILVSIGAITTVVNRQQDQRQDSAIVSELRGLPDKATVDERIRRYEEAIPKLKDSVSKRTERDNLAVLYEEKGKSALNSGDFVTAESAFQRAAELDPDSGAYPSDLGDLYGRFARSATEFNQRIAYFRESAQSWGRAASNETNAERRATYAMGACRAYISLASEYVNSGNPYDAREALYKARDYAERGSPEWSTIEQLIGQTL